MKVAIYGAGGVGGYLAGRLAATDVEVHLLARGRHLDALRTHGLTLRSPHGDAHAWLAATDEPAEVGVCDAVLVCVKATDTDEVAARMAPMLTRGTTVVTFQNGVDNAERLRRGSGHERVLPGLAYIFSTIEAPGVVAHTAGPGTFVLGDPAGPGRGWGTEVAEVLAGAGIDARWDADIVAAVWRKFAFICAQAGMTAGARQPIGRIREVDAAWSMFAAMVDEVLRLAVAEGIDLPAGTHDELLELAAGLPAQATSSLHHDLEAARPSELEHLHGAVVRRARDADVPAPMHEAVHALLRVWEEANVAST